MNALLYAIRWPWRVVRYLLISRPIRFTRLGWFYIAFTLGVGGAAINTGNNLLYMILGLLLAFIVLSGIFSDSALWGVRFTWFPNGDLFVNRPAILEVELFKKGFPAALLDVRLKDEGGQTARLFFPWIPRNQSRFGQMRLTPQKRGVYRLSEIRYTSAFPFGLFEKFHEEEIEKTWVVYPRIYDITLSDVLGQGRHFAAQPTLRRGIGSTTFDVRLYQPGDPAKRMDWKRSARHQQWLVKELEEESSLGRTLGISQWPTTPEKLESLISFAASLAYALSGSGIPVGLRTSDRYFSPQRTCLTQILTYLALAKSLPGIQILGASSDLIDVFALWKERGQ